MPKQSSSMILYVSTDFNDWSSFHKWKIKSWSSRGIIDDSQSKKLFYNFVCGWMNRFFYELRCDSACWVFIEYRIHKCYESSTASRIRLGHAILFGFKNIFIIIMDLSCLPVRPLFRNLTWNVAKHAPPGNVTVHMYGGPKIESIWRLVLIINNYKEPILIKG